MCGINGFITKNIVSDVSERISRMNEALSHRGPDAKGQLIFNGGRVALGQRRLSIIDLEERANQPMRSASMNSVIVYNGEIYNYKELREKIDYSFVTNSDTEVILAGLENNGADWINLCNGMFAFAFYDSVKKKMLLARDRLGIKPLYYYNDGDFFVFSSEIKGILNSGLVKAEFNYDAVDEYLGNRYVREPYTFFKNIYQLPAGCFLEIEDDLKCELKRYWDLPLEFNRSDEYNEYLIYEEFKDEVTKAIKRRMLSDVPLGTYLSGGIDSSIISAVTAMNSMHAVNTYTIGFPELNEFTYAEMVAEKYKTAHHAITMESGNYFSLMSELISYKDAPLGVPNEIPLAVMSKKLKEKITVVLSGEGADELMGGYGRIFRSPFDYEHIDRECGKDFYQYFTEKYEYVPRQIRDTYLTVKHPLRNEFDSKIRNEFKAVENDENVFRFFHKYHVKGLLQRVDTTTMYASVEARVPFLDHELVEFCYKNVPYELKLKWKSKEGQQKASITSAEGYSDILDSPKYLLKKFGLEILPKEVVTRKKMGFPVPLNDWFGDLISMAGQLLADTDWLASNKLSELICDCKKDSRGGQLLWMFINVELFKQMYFYKEWRY